MNWQGADGVTWLYTASMMNDLDAVEALVNAGVNPNHFNQNDVSALMVAAANGHLDVVKILLKGGAVCIKQMFCGETPLMFAAQNGYLPIVNCCKAFALM